MGVQVSQQLDYMFGKECFENSEVVVEADLENQITEKKKKKKKKKAAEPEVPLEFNIEEERHRFLENASSCESRALDMIVTEEWNKLIRLIRGNEGASICIRIGVQLPSGMSRAGFSYRFRKLMAKNGLSGRLISNWMKDDPTDVEVFAWGWGPVDDELNQESAWQGLNFTAHVSPNSKF